MEPSHGDEWHDTAADLTGPLYAVVGAGTAYQGSHGWSGSGDDRTVSAALRHAPGDAELDVEVDDHGGFGGDDWLLTHDWLRQAVRPGEVSFPLTLTADRWEQEVPVDGVPVRFVFVGTAATWCARADVGGRQVSVAATGWPHDGLGLMTVAVGDVSEDLPG